VTTVGGVLLTTFLASVVEAIEMVTIVLGVGEFAPGPSPAKLVPSTTGSRLRVAASLLAEVVATLRKAKNAPRRISPSSASTNSG
jgi:hypothetical protein